MTIDRRTFIRSALAAAGSSPAFGFALPEPENQPWLEFDECKVGDVVEGLVPDTRTLNPFKGETLSEQCRRLPKRWTTLTINGVVESIHIDRRGRPWYFVFAVDRHGIVHRFMWGAPVGREFVCRLRRPPAP